MVTSSSGPSAPAEPVPSGLDHLVYGTADLGAAVEAFEQRFGVRAAGGGRHIGRGTHNALLALGGRRYLEIIAPDPSQPEPDLPRPFGLDTLEASGGERLVGWAVACTDISARIAAARQDGYDPGDAVTLERATPDGDVLRWRLTLAAARGGPIPFLIDWGDTTHPSRTAPSGLTLVSFTIKHPAPGAIAPVLSALGAGAVVVEGPPPGALAAVIEGPSGRIDLQ